ncbi:thiamine ABC transporter substrate-binding protein [Nakamurella lactea]|uniref:thiamine ABC transporter substrate-binding protein n=1 Tax=Nakamurella lactea TaxID=459515 RepID=UPI000421D36D|nr:thiamine ABC transporter substrate-binding protein [Nakamurella lactea]
MQNRSSRHRSGRRAAAGLAATTALLTVLAGCGSDAAGGQTPGPAAGADSSAATTAGGGSTGAGSSAGSSSAATGSAATGSAATGSAATGSAATGGAATGGTVTLVTHDSFNMDKKVLAKFQTDTGITLKILAQGDAGAMVNKLVLTKDAPLGDVVFGIDNTFASRALDAGVLQPYAPPAAHNGADKYSIGGGSSDDQNRLTAVDYGDVCVNVDHTWFANKKLAEPKTYEDLAKPEYKDLLVVPSPATSSPGLAFLLGTIAHFGGGDSTDAGDGSGWQQYWTALKTNGVKVTAGWEDAYSVDFSGSSGKGARPLVLSYASSPPFEVKPGETKAPTGALLDTCFRQVEYTGVLAGAANPERAKKVVDFLLSKEFQAAMPDQMYVYPVDDDVALPKNWQQFAPAAKDPASLPADQIAAHRDQWIQTWTDLVEG